ncbi:MAG TPA: hypothetical protein DCP90_06290 [Clostridiales bacterium]|nr:MAG: hypothetical protein A2Y22_00985 [Clostridiales bacterium GWD2_32_59]HAN10204.1 hypothetical protein [Clostridiales bacterium]
MKFSFSKTKKQERFSPQSKYTNQNMQGQSFEDIARHHKLSEPFMYESGNEEDFTDFDSIKKPNK